MKSLTPDEIGLLAYAAIYDPREAKARAKVRWPHKFRGMRRKTRRTRPTILPRVPMPVCSYWAKA